MKMKAQELRIGNFVWSNDSHYDRIEDFVIEIKDSRIGLKNRNRLFPIENIEAIYLTEEWLVRFGFTKSQEGFVRKKVNRVYHYLEVNIKAKRTILIKDIYWFSLLNCDYVHQLQNLYFALTGEELIIKS